METKTSTSKYWLGFFVSLALMSYMIYNPATRPYFWTVLPFVTTFFAKGMDIM